MTAPTIPEGYVLVPCVLTPAMREEIRLIAEFSDLAMQTRYAAMLAAAPAIPLPAAPVQGWVSVKDRLPDNKSGFVLVTNNINAKSAFGTMSHVWITLMIHEHDDGNFTAFAHPTMGQTVEGITHWHPILPPPPVGENE